MNFNNDNSTQLNIGSATFTPSYSSKTAPNLLLNDSSSGIYNPSLNTIKFFTNNIDAFTIDENQCLYGNATGLTNLGYSNIINKPSTFPSDWGTLANKPSTFPADMTNIYTKTQTDSFLNTKQNILTFQSPLENAANTISLNTTNLITTTGGQTINGTLTTSGYLYTQNIQPINTGLAQNLNLTQRLTGNINFNCEGAGTINCIINGVNRFYVNSAGNAVLAGNLYEGGQLLSGKYQAKLTASTALLGIGSAITEINYDNITTNKPDLTVYATTTALNGKENTLTFSAPLNRTLNTISIDLSPYLTSSTASTTYATITNLNNLSTNSTLNISNLNTTSTTIFNNLNSLSTNSILSINNLNATSTTIFNKTAFSSLYVTGVTTFQNSITCASSLNVSGTTTLSNNTTINGSLNVTGAITGSGSGLTSLNYNNIFNPPAMPNLNNASTFVSSLNVSGNTTLANVTTCVSSLNVSGNTTLANVITCLSTLSGTTINANTSLRIANNLVNDFCFNNLGFNHADITDFNAPTGFGCRFIFGNTNGPSVNYGSQTSSYTLFMGLGINYPASGTGSYGCQLALQRSVTNPTLSVRYKENNAWSGWSAITAGVLNGTAILKVGVWHTSSDNQQRLYFDNNGTTFIQGQGTIPIVFRNNANVDICSITSSGVINASGGSLTGALTVNNNLNITGSATNALIFDNVFNNNKIKLNNNNGIGVDTDGVLICSSGAVRFANSTGAVINATITPAGDFSFLGTVYSGAVSTGGTVYATGTITGGSFTEGGVTLNSKYLRLNGTNNMTGNLNITTNGKLIFNDTTDDMRLQLYTGYGFGINGNTLRYNSPNTHRFYTGTATSMVINSAGNMGIGTDTPRARLDVYNNDMIVRGTNEGDVARLYLGTPYTVDSALKTAIIAEGINSWSRCKLHLCVNTILNNSSAYNASVADARLTIDTNGNVAIGQTSAAYPLVVTGTTNSFTITSASRKYDEYGPIGNTPPYNMTGIVAYFNGNVLTPGFYVAFSDERLKKEIEELSNDFALQTIMKLKPIKYNLIDNIYNNNINYGFSAQEVQKVLPEAVISTKHYLPNIYQNVDKVDNANSNIMIDAKIIASNLNVNDNIRIVTHSNEEQIKKIVSINDNIITLDSKIDNYKEGDPLFLYGKEQEDIRCVNHNFLYNVNIKATQVLYEIIMKQQQEIEKLTNALISSNIISPL